MTLKVVLFDVILPPPTLSVIDTTGVNVPSARNVTLRATTFHLVPADDDDKRTSVICGLPTTEPLQFTLVRKSAAVALGLLSVKVASTTVGLVELRVALSVLRGLTSVSVLPTAADVTKVPGAEITPP